MKIFHRDHLSCGHRVAYLPDAQLVLSLDQMGTSDGADRSRSPLPNTAKGGY